MAETTNGCSKSGGISNDIIVSHKTDVLISLSAIQFTLSWYQIQKLELKYRQIRSQVTATLRFVFLW
jgi:hypothetical protein